MHSLHTIEWDQVTPSCDRHPTHLAVTSPTTHLLLRRGSVSLVRAPEFQVTRVGRGVSRCFWLLAQRSWEPRPRLVYVARVGQ